MSKGSEVGSGKLRTENCGLRAGGSETLPRGWVTTPVGDICEQIRGVSYNKNDVRFVKTPDYLPLLRANNINEAIVFSDLQYVPKSIVNKKQLLKMGDVLIAMSSGSKKVVGKTASLGQDWLGTFGAFCGVLRPLQSINNGFCQFFFKTQYYRNAISKLATGTNINNIKTTHFDEIILPLPPLNEQKRIVARLDKIMPRIDAVKERLDKVPAIIKRFKQSVLTDAVTGKLTEKWRVEHQDVESAEVLLKNINKTKNELHRQKKITKPNPALAIGDDDIKFEVPDSWLWCRLAQISFKMSTGPFGTMLHKSDYISKGIPVINPTNIKNSAIIPSEKMMISQNTLERLNRYKLDVNDVIIARRGDLSKCGIVTDM